MATTPSSMKAGQVARFGGPEVFGIKTVHVPAPGPGEVLLQVRAASVNPVDYKIREGKFPPVQQEMLPYTLGRDASGVVVARGASVTAIKEGDELYAYLGVDRGGYAEFVLVRESEAAPKPKSVDHTTAAAVPLAGITAWQGLFRHGELKAGQRVLIHAGSGGVGHFAIQFAKAVGAHVTTTVSSDNVAFVKQIGADVVIDHKVEKFEEKVSGMDLVFDLLGGETQERSFGVLKQGGRLVSTVQEPAADTARAHGVKGVRYMAEPSSADLRQIAELIDAGKVKPRVSKTFALADAARALALIEEGHTSGKVVMTT